MSKLKILIVSPAFAPYSGVGANRMVSLANYLTKKFQEVFVIRNIANSLSHLYTAREPENITFYDIKIHNDSDFANMSEIYVETALKVIADNNISCVIVSVGPYYTYKTVIEIGKKGIPVIIDFRDLFVYERSRLDGIIKQFRRFIYHKRFTKLEYDAVNASKAVVTVVKDDLLIMKHHYSSFKGEISLIMNGFDEDRINDDSKIGLTVNYGGFKIGVFGKLSTYNEKLTTMLFSSIKQLNCLGYDIHLYQLGPFEEKNLQIIRSAGMNESSYHYLGSVDYASGINTLRSMDALTFVYSSPTGYGTKIFDYIYLNKPVILLTTKQSALGRFVNSFENGFSCTNIDSYKEVVEYVIKNQIKKLSNEDSISNYSRNMQNQKYEALIERLV